MSGHTAGPLIVVYDGPNKHVTQVRQRDNGAWVCDARSHADAELFSAGPEMLIVIQEFVSGGLNVGHDIELLEKAKKANEKARFKTNL